MKPLPLVAYNYSRLLGREHRYEECIEVAEIGRQCCVSYNRCQVLGGLLLNIACSKHELGEDEEAKEFLIESYSIYKVMERLKSCQLVQNYAKNEFGVDIG